MNAGPKLKEMMITFEHHGSDFNVFVKNINTLTQVTLGISRYLMSACTGSTVEYVPFSGRPSSKVEWDDRNEYMRECIEGMEYYDSNTKRFEPMQSGDEIVFTTAGGPEPVVTRIVYISNNCFGTLTA